MVGRSKSFDERMAKKFEDQSYAQGYFIYNIEEDGLELDEALRDTIKSMGMKSFADKTGLSLQAVSDFVSKRQSWSTDKLAKHIYQALNLKMKYSFVVAS